MKKVKYKNRNDFMFNKMGNEFIRFEQLAFYLANKFSQDYSGGYWDFYDLENGGFFIGLDEDDKYRFVNAMNYSDFEFNGVEFGAVITLLALGMLMHHGIRKSEDMFYKLKDEVGNIFDRETAMKIYQAID